MTEAEKTKLRMRCLDDALFRQWAPVLNRLARQGVADAVEVWHEAECAIRRLKHVEQWRDVEVEQVYTNLCRKYAGREMEAVAVMAVLFSLLSDAAVSADEADANPHAPVCRAIGAMLGDDRRFLTLLNAFLERGVDNYGRPVVLPVTDYLAQTPDDENDDAAFGASSSVSDDGGADELYRLAVQQPDIDHARPYQLALYRLGRREQGDAVNLYFARRGEEIEKQKTQQTAYIGTLNGTAYGPVSQRMELPAERPSAQLEKP